MIAIGDVLVQEDLLKYQFACDLNACKGACCVEGDSGAPLRESELQLLESLQEAVAPYLTDESLSTLAEKGAWISTGEDGKYATPLNSDGACAYVIRENGIAFCGIEKAWKEGKTDFQKPVSCHLYPAREGKYRGMDSLHYERWQICNPACKNGKALGIPVFRFVKDALIRRYGQEFYDILEARFAQTKGRG
jgi:hypothetical protein